MSNIINMSNSSTNSQYSAISSVKSPSASLQVFKDTPLTKLADLFANNYGKNNAKLTKSAADAYEVKALGSQLQDALSKLTTANKNSLYDEYTKASSNKEVATVEATKTTAPAASTNLQVDNIAKAQVNSDSSKALQASKIETSSGNYKFEVSVGNKQHSFEIKVKASDSNKAIQDKMASAINSKNIGITASVATDSKTGTSLLSVSSKKTGVNAAFEINDVEGDLASKMGITNTSQKAENALYRVNGGEQKTSETNAVELSKGVTATLKAKGTTEISSKVDSGAAVAAAKEFASAMNDVLAYAKETSGKGAFRLVDDVWGMNDSYSKSLARAGITANKDGILQTDDKKLAEAAENGNLAKLFQDNSGFARRANSIANSMESGSSYYTNSREPTSQNQNNYQNQYQRNPYAAIGMLFESGF